MNYSPTLYPDFKPTFRATDAVREAEKHSHFRQKLMLKVVGLNKEISALVSQNCKLDDKMQLLQEYKDFCALVNYNKKSMKPETSIETQLTEE